MPAARHRRAPGRPNRSGRGPAALGFTLIELLIVVAVVGLIAAIIIPNFLASVQKARQRRTMAEMHSTGRAMVSWVTDQVGAAAAGTVTFDMSDYGSALPHTDLAGLLVPEYLPELPQRDAWGSGIEYYLDTADLFGYRVMAIRSPGRDGTFSGDSYLHSAFASTDFDQDLVWADGIFVRWPQGTGSD